MKIWAYVILAGLIITGITVGINAIYAAGYNARDLEVQQEIIEAQKKAADKAVADWKETVEQAESEIVIEEKIVERIRIVEKEIPKIVKEIVEVKPECSNLGIDYARVRNNQIRAANNREDPEPSATLVN